MNYSAVNQATSDKSGTGHGARGTGHGARGQVLQVVQVVQVLQVSYNEELAKVVSDESPPVESLPRSSGGIFLEGH